MNSLLGVLAAIIAYLFYQNKKLKSKTLSVELKNEKEKLHETQEKSNSARDRFLDLLERYRKGKD